MRVLAIDAGTTTVKAAVVDADGRIEDVARRPVPRDRTHSDGLDADAFWQAVVGAITDLATSSAKVDAVAVAGQGDGLWALDGQGRPVGDVLEWNSPLGAPYVSAWEQDGTVEEHYRRSGTVLWSGVAAPLWHWAKAHRPAIDRTETLLFAKDWIGFRLTGEIATDVTDATIPFLDLETGDYDAASFEALGCPDLAGRMPPILEQGAQLGTISTAAAAETGLPKGLPVLMGCIDVYALTRGAAVNQPGDAAAVLGTTAVVMTLSDELDTSGEPAGAVLRTSLGRPQYLTVVGASSGTSALDWFLEEFMDGRGQHDRFWSAVNRGQPGPLLLPYLAGERAPFLAPDATGTFLGITPSTTFEDLARAVVLGITFALRHCLDHAHADADGRLILSGGGAASPEWCQLVADAVGRPVIVDKRPHVACIGVAAVAAGRRLAPASELPVVEPQQDLDAEYRQFVDVGQSMRPIWSAMSKREDTSR